MTVYTMQPTLDTGAYGSGDVIAGIQTLKGAIARDSALVSVAIMDVDNEGVQYDLVFFSTAPTGTYTDNEAAAIDAADVSKVVGFVSVLTTDYITIGTDKIATKLVSGLNFPRTSTGDLYILIIVRGTPTFAAATDVTFRIGITPL